MTARCAGGSSAIASMATRNCVALVQDLLGNAFPIRRIGTPVTWKGVAGPAEALPRDRGFLTLRGKRCVRNAPGLTDASGLRDVGDDAHDPGRERRPALEAAEALQHTKPRLLHHLFRHRPAAHVAFGPQRASCRSGGPPEPRKRARHRPATSRGAQPLQCWRCAPAVRRRSREAEPTGWPLAASRARNGSAARRTSEHEHPHPAPRGPHRRSARRLDADRRLRPVGRLQLVRAAWIARARSTGCACRATTATRSSRGCSTPARAIGRSGRRARSRLSGATCPARW